MADIRAHEAAYVAHLVSLQFPQATLSGALP